MKSNIKKIGVFTSGGDSPGMNACIRAIVKTALYNNLKIIGIRHGYEGLIEGDFTSLTAESVNYIIHQGGTILKTSRSARFLTKEGMLQAATQLKKNNIDGLVAIGGDGTFKGAEEFSSICSVPIIGIPGTIDNDLYGTDFTLGFDTAVNTVTEAIDKIRDTAESHDRLFFVEVMGRDAGLIALQSGIASGAEAILIPETETHIEALIKMLETGWKRKKSSKIIIVAEGDEAGGAFEISRKVKEQFNRYDTRIVILGHIQRGGNPTCADRVLANRLGFVSIEALLHGKKSVMVGIINNQVSYTPFKQAVKQKVSLDSTLLTMVDILSL